MNVWWRSWGIERTLRVIALAGIALVVAGCNSPALRVVEVRQPLTARPAAIAVKPSDAGAIYQAATYYPLFEDRRARVVGDTLTININEKLNASKTASSTADRKGTTSLDVAKASVGGKTLFSGAAIAGTSKSEFEGKGDSASNNLFTGTIQVTVIEVLSNGYMLVSGEKQLGINQGSEFVRLSGVVNPITVQFGNVVSSTQVADARLEYRGSGYIDEAQTMGWLARAFQSVLPF